MDGSTPPNTRGHLSRTTFFKSVNYFPTCQAHQIFPQPTSQPCPTILKISKQSDIRLSIGAVRTDVNIYDFHALLYNTDRLSRGFSYMWRGEKLRNLVNFPQELKMQVSSGVWQLRWWPAALWTLYASSVLFHDRLLCPCDRILLAQLENTYTDWKSCQLSPGPKSLEKRLPDTLCNLQVRNAWVNWWDTLSRRLV